MSYVNCVIRQGKARLCILKLILVFHHLLRVGQKQLRVLAHLAQWPVLKILVPKLKLEI